MELKPGYKQTEVGVIPEDWDCEPLGSFAQVSTGGTPSRSNPLYWNGLIPWITTAEIDYHQIDGTNEYITEKGLSSSAARLLPPGVLLMAMYGQGKTRGKVAITSIEAATNQACAGIRLEEHISSGFIFYWLANQYHKIRSLSNTGNQENLNLNLIRSILCPLPPTRNEQNNIFEMLVDIDSSIAAIEFLAEKKRQIKHAAMQELLTGKRRLPGFEGEWEVKRLGDIISIDPESLGNNTHPNYRFNYISLEDVNQGSLLGWSEQEYVSAPSRARRKLRPNDVLISTVRPNLKSHLLFHQEGGEWICSTGFALLRCNKDTIEPAFVYFHLFGDTISKQIEALLTGSNYPAINSRDVRNLEIPVPALLEQKEIVRILKSMEDELISLAHQFEKASSLKQGMMQQLLTGKIRLR